MTEVLPKPPVYPSPVSAPFWAAARERRLALQRCTACGAWVHYPRARCPVCWRDALEWRDASGLGAVRSYTIVHRPGHPAWLPDVPYTVALVELEEGPCLVANLVGCPPGRVRVGMPVEAAFVDEGELTLVQFRPV